MLSISFVPFSLILHHINRLKNLAATEERAVTTRTLRHCIVT